jgi:hypothetical protein
MPETYVVVVRHNLVCAIEPAREPPPEGIPATPLEVSSQLAANHLANGCIDGSYYFTDTMHARTFAELCLEFTKALVEKRLAAVNALPVGAPLYRADSEG